MGPCKDTSSIVFDDKNKAIMETKNNIFFPCFKETIRTMKYDDIVDVGYLKKTYFYNYTDVQRSHIVNSHHIAIKASDETFWEFGELSSNCKAYVDNVAVPIPQRGWNLANISPNSTYGKCETLLMGLHHFLMIRRHISDANLPVTCFKTDLETYTGVTPSSD
jgi:hypothetical protein